MPSIRTFILCLALAAVSAFADCPFEELSYGDRLAVHDNFKKYVGIPSGLHQTPAFQWFLHERNPDPSDPQLFIKFLDYRYSGKGVSGMAAWRTGALGRELAAHGAPPAPGQDPRAKLAEISRVNRDRWMKPDVSNVPEMKEVKELLDRHQLTAVHNSRDGDPRHGYLLSSQQLSELGYQSSGYNTRPFNRDLVKSGDNVFFNLGFSAHGPFDVQASSYGRFNTVITDPKFMASEAYVGVNTMYPWNLIAMARKHAPEIFEQLKNDPEIRASGKDPVDFVVALGQGSESEWKFVQARSEIFEKLRGKLSQFDFTVSDFDALARNNILHRMNELRLNDPEAYQRYLQYLRDGKARHMDYVLEDFVIVPMLGRNVGLELRVPVAVPPSSYRFR